MIPPFICTRRLFLDSGEDVFLVDDRVFRALVLELKVGDIVVFSRYGGSELKYKGTEYTIISQKDILATIE